MNNYEEFLNQKEFIKLKQHYKNSLSCYFEEQSLVSLRFCSRSILQYSAFNTLIVQHLLSAVVHCFAQTNLCLLCSLQKVSAESYRRQSWTRFRMRFLQLSSQAPIWLVSDPGSDDAEESLLSSLLVDDRLIHVAATHRFAKSYYSQF